MLSDSFVFFFCCGCCGCNCSDDIFNFKCEDLCTNESDKSNDACGNFIIGLITILLMIVLVVIIGFIYGTYFMTKKCGKLISRIITLGMISFNSILICILCFLCIKEKELIIYIILGISGTIILSNIIRIILSMIYKEKGSKIYMAMNKESSDNSNNNTPAPDPLFGSINTPNEKLTVN